MIACGAMNHAMWATAPPPTRNVVRSAQNGSGDTNELLKQEKMGKITRKTGTFFVCTVAYENEEAKKVKEPYVIDAQSFAEAETKVLGEMTGLINLEMVDISRAQFSEIFSVQSDEDMKYYRVKINIITLDERTGKNRKQTMCFLVMGTSTRNAQANFDEAMRETLVDFSVEAIIETKIVTVY